MRKIIDVFKEVIPEEYRNIALIRGYLFLIIIAGLVLFILFLQSIGGGTGQTKVHISTDENLSKNVNSESDLRTKRSAIESTTTVSKISVQVAGCVKTRGVFEVDEDFRVFDVVRLANPREDACLDVLNLARKVSDGERIYVPSNDEVKKAGWPGVLLNQIVAGSQQDSGFAGGGSGSGGGSNLLSKKYDLNTCSKEELVSVPGIGEKTAEKIIAYREKKGGFKSVEELLEVSGIGEKKLESMKDYFVVVK